MDKNTVTGFVLMAAVLIAFTWYSRPSEEQLRAAHERDSIAALQQQMAMEAEAAQAAARQQAAAASAPLDSTSALFAASQGTDQLVTLENDLVRLTINTHGGVIEEAVIKNHLDQQKQPVRLLTKEDAALTLSLAGKNENIVTRDLYFQIASPTHLASPSPEISSSSP
ncbi:MAG: YidC/Oxa1 family insertase periplasmic-domain containing protein, partial [Bacteroidaceae bacterium]|nr:YidC/Oxa1 family insertase periplasmic-domain containing protein [Bacteroidaceae bacterium]